MPNRIRIYPYITASRSAMALARGLGGKVIRRKNSRYVKRTGDSVINWGATRLPFKPNFNQPEAVALASDKLRAFERLQEAGVRIPEFTDDIDNAEFANWRRTVCRTRHGTGGYGIEIVEREDDIPEAELYVQYIRKSAEYRVHVMNGSTFFVQQKLLSRSYDGEPNWRVRSKNNGFIFAHKGLDVPTDVTYQAEHAVMALNLDFGAVDVVWNRKRQEATVLEVNTAPGLQGATINRYVEAFMENTE